MPRENSSKTSFFARCAHSERSVFRVIYFYKTIDGAIREVDAIEPGVWVELTSPTADEIERIASELAVERDYITAALDEEETSRVEVEDDHTLIMVDMPTVDDGESHVLYSTLPLGIIVTDENIVTVSLRENPIVDSMRTAKLNTAHKTRFIFTLLLRIAGRYNLYLRQIERISSSIERKLYKSQRNKELIQLLDLEKSLVFFSTSLKANEVTLDKIMRGRVIKLYEEDQDLLEDVLIEVRQAIEMANIYSSILSGTMDAFASVISNNLNVTMKRLASLTVLIEIPTIIYSLYGMNVDGLPMAHFWFPMALSGGLMLIVFLILHKLKLL